MNKTIVIRMIVGGIVVLLLFLQGIGFEWTRKDIFVACQSPNIGVRYVPYESYCFSIVRRGRTFNSDYIVRITEKNRPDYGYGFLYPLWSGFSERGSADTKVEWMQDGVSFDFSQNAKVFIPKENFIGGR